MKFKETKTYKELKKIIKINIIVCVIFSLSCIPYIAISLGETSLWKTILIMLGAIVVSIIFFFPISFIYFIFALIDEFVKKDSKLLKVILKIVAAHIFPAIIFILGWHCEIIRYKSSICGELNEFGIVAWLYLFISIPLSIIYLINAIISDLYKKFKKQ